eukprot:COSAG01_NODE_27633_length_680_cov_5.970740_2_plen_22_part_01
MKFRLCELAIAVHVDTRLDTRN